MRYSNSNIQPLLIACQIDPRLSDYSRSFQGTECLKVSLQESLDLAITLSLSSTLNDHEQHALWLAKLLLNERSQTNVSWTIISYQNGEGQNQKNELGTAGNESRPSACIPK